MVELCLRRMDDSREDLLSSSSLSLFSSPSQFFFETVRVEESVEILSFDPSFFQKKSKREKKDWNVAESKQEDRFDVGKCDE